jgi:hypothetical protein
MNIMQKARDHSNLRDRLQAEFSLADDDEALADTLEGLSDFADIAIAALREAKTREAMAEAMDAIIADNRARKDRHKAASERIRTIVAEAMMDAGETKLAAPDMTVSVRHGKPKLSFDLDRLPEEYKVAEVVFKANRAAIQEHVDNGDVPEGVTISNSPPVITVRAR